MKRLWFAALLAMPLLAAAGCGGDDDDDATAEPAAATQAGGGASATNAAGRSPAASSPAASQPAGPDAKLPEDACALLAAADVGKVLTSPGAGRGAKESAQPGVSTVLCNWSGGTAAGGNLTLVINQIPADARKAARDSLAALTRQGGKEVKDLGDYAVVTAVQTTAAVRIVVKGLTVELGYTERVERGSTAPGATAKEADLIALARAIVAKL